MFSKWAERHRNNINLILHLIGIPLTIAALPVLIFCSFGIAALLFIAGYALQFLGHAIERNKSGEQILLEKILRRHKID